MLRYFNGTIISASFLLLFSLWFYTFALELNNLVGLTSLNSTIAPLQFIAGSSLEDCHKLPDVFEWLLLYSIKLYIGITTSMPMALSTCITFILLMQLVNGAKIISFLLVLFAYEGTAAVFWIFIVVLTRILASL